MKELYRQKTRFMYDIRDLFYLARNLDQLRNYAGDPKWRTERTNEDTILDYHGDDLLSKTTYLDENPPTYLKAEIVITGLEDYPFQLQISLDDKGKNQTVVEYKLSAEIPDDFDLEAINDTIDEFRKSLYIEFAKASHNLELERRKQETATPFVDMTSD